MVQSTTAMVVPVDPAHRLNEDQLLRYLQAHVAGFLPPPASLQVSQVINLEHAIFLVYAPICLNHSFVPLFLYVPRCCHKKFNCQLNLYSLCQLRHFFFER